MSKSDIIRDSNGVFVLHIDVPEEEKVEDTPKYQGKFHQFPDRFIKRESFNPDDGGNEIRIPRKGND